MAAMSQPLCVILAGANGSGKTTVSSTILKEELGVLNYLNADVLAQGLSGFSVDEVAFKAGELMLKQMEELVVAKVDFAFETTLANRSLFSSIHRWKQSGFRVALVYIWLRSPDINVQRVAERVRRGGHNIPEETIRRRYERSLSNFFNLYMPIVDGWRFCENLEVVGVREIAAGNHDVRVYDDATWNELNARWKLG
jgi:predicted ABC-type ATPase